MQRRFVLIQRVVGFDALKRFGAGSALFSQVALKPQRRHNILESYSRSMHEPQVASVPLRRPHDRCDPAMLGVPDVLG